MLQQSARTIYLTSGTSNISRRYSQLLRSLPGRPGGSNLLDEPVSRGVPGPEQALATHA